MCESNQATQAGGEKPERPSKMDIWTNRRINLKTFDRFYNDGWKFMPNKHLDLAKDYDYKILTVLPKRQNILNYVNLHDELPDGIRQTRLKDADNSAADYDIREMWEHLCKNEAEAMENATIFQHTNAADVGAVSQTTCTKTNILSTTLRDGKFSPTGGLSTNTRPEDGVLEGNIKIVTHPNMAGTPGF